ncbi:CocE/NonD family hydrolase [bacterium]|nr:CocE/NonD family hydrolase [bacterium]
MRSRPVRGLFLVLLLLWLAVPVSRLAADTSPAAYRVREELDVKVEMRDGVRLSANIYRPDTAGAFPALLLRTPYGNGGAGNGEGHFFASRGYAVVLMDVRGRGESEGLFDAVRNERDDGVDSQKWLAAQSWCNGRFGTFGGSYVGFTQWMPAPQADQDRLVAMFPVVTASDMHDEVYYGGAFRMSLWSAWSFEMTLPYGLNAKRTDEQLMKIYESLPLADQDRLAGWKVPFLRDWLSHPEHDRYWEPTTVGDGHSKIRAAAFNVGGWFDILLHGTLNNFSAMTASGIDPAVRAGQRLLIGPWVHSFTRDGRTGELDFGKGAVLDVRQIELQWFDNRIKGLDTGLDTLGPVRLFVMGRNEWRNEKEWPLARTQYRDFYLDGGGKANTRNGDGVLSEKVPARDNPDRFVYDPRDPVLSAMEGPYDEAAKELRGDILVYTTAALDADLEVTGPVRAVLWAESSAPSTDFTVKLLDVHPDGRAMSLCDGIVRATYREPGKAPTPIQPGKIYEYSIDLWATSNVFLKGHRIRVEVSSSNFPRFDRNLNTGEDFATGTRIEKASQGVHHGKLYPSRIVLPVIP